MIEIVNRFKYVLLALLVIILFLFIRKPSEIFIDDMIYLNENFLEFYVKEADTMEIYNDGDLVYKDELVDDYWFSAFHEDYLYENQLNDVEFVFLGDNFEKRVKAKNLLYTSNLNNKDLKKAEYFFLIGSHSSEDVFDSLSKSKLKLFVTENFNDELDFAMVSKFKNLQAFSSDLSYAHKNIDSLSSNTNLKFLKLEELGQADMSFVKKLKDLIIIDFSLEGTFDFDLINGLKSVTDVELRADKYEGELKLKKLIYLYLSVDTEYPLNNFSNLKGDTLLHLTLDGPFNGSATDLPEGPVLRNIYLRIDSYDDQGFNYLDEYPNLKELDID